MSESELQYTRPANLSGDYGEMFVTATLRKAGHGVLIPSGHEYPYDLVVDKDMSGLLIKCQIKTRSSDRKSVTFPLCAQRRETAESIRYPEELLDCIIVFDSTTERVFVVPYKNMDTKRKAMSLHYDELPMTKYLSWGTQWARVYENRWDFLDKDSPHALAINDQYGLDVLFESVLSNQEELLRCWGKYFKQQEFAKTFGISNIPRAKKLLENRLGLCYAGCKFGRADGGYLTKDLIDVALQQIE